MRKITIEDGLRVGFPGRDGSFYEGVEAGMMATLMALGFSQFTREITSGNMDQVRVLGRKLGYHVGFVEQTTGDLVRVTFQDRKGRPKLRLVGK